MKTGTVRQTPSWTLATISFLHWLIGLVFLAIYAKKSVWISFPKDVAIRNTLGILGVLYVFIGSIVLLRKRGTLRLALFFDRFMQIGLGVLAVCLLPACVFPPLGVFLLATFYAPAVVVWFFSRSSARRLREVLTGM